MPKFVLALTIVLAALAPAGLAQEAGPYKVLKRAKVGGEGGWDYIFADAAGRRLYIPRARIPRNSRRRDRLSIFNLDTLELVGEITGIGGQGAMVDPKSGHGFTSNQPISMFDTKTIKLHQEDQRGQRRARRHLLRFVQSARIRLQPPDERRDGDRCEGQAR